MKVGKVVEKKLFSNKRVDFYILRQHCVLVKRISATVWVLLLGSVAGIWKYYWRGHVTRLGAAKIFTGQVTGKCTELTITITSGATILWMEIQNSATTTCDILFYISSKWSKKCEINLFRAPF